MADNHLQNNQCHETDSKGFKDKCIESPLPIAQNVMQHFENEDMLRTNTMFTIKGLTILFMTQLILISCAPTQEKTDQGQQTTYSLTTTNTDSLPELTAEQQSSFDALNTLQISTD